MAWTVLIIVAFLAYLILNPFVEYLMDKKGLKRYPGPFVAALTPFWMAYHSWGRERYKVIEYVHEKYGPIVRIGPNQVSFTDPVAFRDIHGHGSSIIKDDFYAHIAAGNPSMAQTTSRAEHSRKRRFMSHVFSPKEITAMEPRVQEVVQKLVKCLRIKACGGMIASTDAYPVSNGAFDVRPWLNMFSYDAITSMFWSNTYGLLDKGNDLCPAMNAYGETYYVHAMASFHGTTSYLVPLAQLTGFADRTLKKILKNSVGHFHVGNFGAMVRYLVTKRLDTEVSEPDLFSSLPIEPTPKRPDPVPLSELTAECTTMLDAGNDTTQTSLTNCMFQLSIHKSIQTKLRNELVSALSKDSSTNTDHTNNLPPTVIDNSTPTPVPIPSYQILQHIPYLRAVLDESFRCRPPIAFGLPRRTVQPTTVAGELVPANVTVSAPLYSIHKDPTLFTRPDEFIPERWLGEDDEPASAPSSDLQQRFSLERKNLRDYVLPFSLGGRACIGRNLAYMELSICIASLVLGFEWDIADEHHLVKQDGTGKMEYKMDILERLNANPKELWVRGKARDGALAV